MLVYIATLVFVAFVCWLMYWYITRCRHTYSTIARHAITNEANATIGWQYIMQCTKCGTLKGETFFG